MSQSHPSSILGMAALARSLIAGENAAVWDGLAARYQADTSDADALFDMAMMLRLTGKLDACARLQAAALQLRSCFTCRHGRAEALSVLVMVTGADVMANAPIDFLCEGADVTLHFLHLDGAASAEVPPHDVAFVAIGQAEGNNAILQHLPAVLAAWPTPVMNGAPDRVLAMTRDSTSALFEDRSDILAPANLKVGRAVVEQLAAGAATPGALSADFAYPMLIRPLNTHGGKGLEKIDDPAGWGAYLDVHPDAAFFLAPFVDYRDRNGWYPKLRITFIDGRPYPTHMAASGHWLAHYISAGMLESADKRALEEAWMTGFDQDFAVRHADALQTIAERFGVDYFSIDCAETPDRRLLLFEADVASIVHALDPAEVFPYKRPAMDKLFAGFLDALRRRADAGVVRAACA